MNRFSSASHPVAERKSAYESALRTYFGNDCVDRCVQVDMGQPDSFLASMEPFQLGYLRGAIHMSNAPHTLNLGPCENGAEDLDFYLLLNGEITFEGVKSTVQLRGGEMALLRPVGPLSSHSEQMDMIAFRLPQRLFHRKREQRPLALNRAVSGRAGLGACLGALLRTAAQRRHDLSEEEGFVLQSSVVETVMQAVAFEDDALVAATREQDAKLRLLKRSALCQLHNAELSPRRLADDIGVSARTLHRLFHSSGATFRDWLRDERLERCWNELTEPAKRRRSVAEVAFRWGFNDLTTFNRSFRAKFGVCPSAAKSARANNDPPLDLPAPIA